MEVLPSYNQAQFMEYAPRVRKKLDEWYIVELLLTGKTHHNAPYLALKLRDYFDAIRTGRYSSATAGTCWV